MNFKDNIVKQKIWDKICNWRWGLWQTDENNRTGYQGVFLLVCVFSRRRNYRFQFLRISQYVCFGLWIITGISQFSF